MANKVKFGLKNVHYAVVTETTDSTTGEITSSYGTEKAWPGAVSLTLDPSGDDTPFYADDGVYYMTSSNNGYTGSLETALIPEDVEIAVFGQTKNETSGVVIETSNDVKKYVALLFEFAGDTSKTRYCFFRCSLQRPSVASSTKAETAEPITSTVNITATPRPDDDVVKAYADENSTAYAGWYTAVPTVSVG